MSNTSRRKFAPDFKAKVSLAAVKEQQTIEEISKKYDLHPSQVNAVFFTVLILGSIINAENLQRSPDAYKRRKGLCGHPFGTIKRSYGMYYTNRKGILNVLGEYSLACLVYNMKRTINIMGHENTMALLHKVA